MKLDTYRFIRKPFIKHLTKKFGVHENPINSEKRLYPTHASECVNFHIRKVTTVNLSHSGVKMRHSYTKCV